MGYKLELVFVISLLIVSSVDLQPTNCDKGNKRIEIDKIYSDVFATELSDEVNISKPKTTLRKLSILAGVFENDENKVEELDQVRRLLRSSDITDDKCNDERLLRLNWRKEQFIVYDVNIVPYCEYYNNLQYKHCKKLLSRMIKEATENFDKVLVKKSIKIFRAVWVKGTKEQRSILHRKIDQDLLVEGLVDLMYSKKLINKRDISKKRFKLEFSKYDKMCRPLYEIVESALDFYDSMSEAIPVPNNEDRPVLAMARICRQVLIGLQEDLPDIAYEYWNSNEEKFPYKPPKPDLREKFVPPNIESMLIPEGDELLYDTPAMRKMARKIKIVIADEDDENDGDEDENVTFEDAVPKPLAITQFGENKRQKENDSRAIMSIVPVKRSKA